MKLAKKLLALALAGVLAVTVLTGCGDSVRQAFKREVGAASVKAYPGLTTQQLDKAIREAKEAADAVQRGADQNDNDYKSAQQNAFWTKFNDKTNGLLKKGIKTNDGSNAYITVTSIYKPAGVKDVARQLRDYLGGVAVTFGDNKKVSGTGTMTGMLENNQDALKGKNVYIACSTETLPDYIFGKSDYRLAVLGSPDGTDDWL